MYYDVDEWYETLSNEETGSKKFKVKSNGVQIKAKNLIKAKYLQKLKLEFVLQLVWIE